MKIFMIISIITLILGVIFTLFHIITLIKYIIIKPISATIISKDNQSWKHGLILYEYEINTNGYIKHIKGPQNIYFNPLFHNIFNVGDIVKVKYDKKRNKILPKLSTILFYILIGIFISIIGILMLIFTSIMMI